jgi:hypothetical protein
MENTLGLPTKCKKINRLDKCNKIEKLNFNAKIKIKEGIKGASKGYFPISLAKLKNENKQLYDSIVNSSIENS